MITVAVSIILHNSSKPYISMHLTCFCCFSELTRLYIFAQKSSQISGVLVYNWCKIGVRIWSLQTLKAQQSLHILLRENYGNWCIKWCICCGIHTFVTNSCLGDFLPILNKSFKINALSHFTILQNMYNLVKYAKMAKTPVTYKHKILSKTLRLQCFQHFQAYA